MTEQLDARSYTAAQERLLRATLETINEMGIDKATTRRIAERADANLQLIQYHFGGKDAMIIEAQHYVGDRFFEVLGPVILDAPSLVEAIRQGMSATWEMAQEQPEIVQPDLLLQTVRAGKEEERELEDRQTQRRIIDMLDSVSKRTGDRLLVPTEQFALLVSGGLSGLILDFRVTGDVKRTSAAIKTFSELLVSLVAPSS